MFRTVICVTFLVVSVYGQMADQGYASSSAMPMTTGMPVSASTTTASYGYGDSSSGSGSDSSSNSTTGSNNSTSSPSSGLPKKPSPVAGSTAPTSDSFTSTTNLPFDFFSGISIRQLDIVRVQVANIFQMAAQSAFVNATQGSDVFGTIVDYIQSLWFPNDAKNSGLPYTVIGGDSGGGSLLSKEPYWDSSAAQAIATAYGRSIGDRLDHMLAFDPVGFARVESDITYRSYLQYRAAGSKLGDVILLYLHRTIQQTAAADYVMGASFTDEVHSALKTVFRFINWHGAITADLYEKRVYQRYEGIEDDSCLEVAPLDLTPSELKYPIPVNSSAQMNIQMQATSANRTFGPLTLNGTPKSSSLATARVFSDRTKASSNFGSMMDMLEGKALKVSAAVFPHPQPAAGSTPLMPAPYSAGVGKTLDRYSGMNHQQLAVAYSAWKNVTRAAAAAAGVAEADGAKVFVKQAQYTFLLWHSEYSAIFGYTSVEDIWNSPTVDATLATSGTELDQIIVGITQNNDALSIRTIDRVSFRNYRTSRALGQSWFTLAYHAFNLDAQMEAAQFFLGDSLNDEAYSALESILSFIALKEYQVYHSYNNGYRIRPFAEDNEFVGAIFGSGMSSFRSSFKKGQMIDVEP